MREGDKWKTESLEINKYLIMLYSLVNALSVFQSFINDVLRDILDSFVITYIDDILTYSSSFSDHVEHVKAVLWNLFVKADRFHRLLSLVMLLVLIGSILSIVKSGICHWLQ